MVVPVGGNFPAHCLKDIPRAALRAFVSTLRVG